MSNKEKNCSPLFIIGAPRSGTTFISKFFSRTHFGTPFETHFIPKAYKAFLKIDNLDNFSDFKKVVDVIHRERSIQQYVSIRNPEIVFDKLPSPRSFRDIVDYYCLAAGDKKSTDWSDKTPWYILKLDLLNEIFPDAKYVYIYRDGRDVACSLLEKSWGPSNIFSCAKLWQDHNEKHKKLIAKLIDEERLVQVSYEELIGEPDISIRKVFKELHIDLDEEYLAAVTPHTKSENKNKWEKKLSVSQINTFEAVAGNTLTNLGYKLHSDNLSDLPFYKVCFYGAAEHVYRAYDLFKINIIDGVLIKLKIKKPFDA